MTRQSSSGIYQQVEQQETAQSSIHYTSHHISQPLSSSTSYYTNSPSPPHSHVQERGTHNEDVQVS